jgi:hypothetical protein
MLERARMPVQFVAAMNNVFKEFDFRLLDDPNFREDSVREELVVPLLKALGFSASPPHQIIRSKPLEHPYVYIGTAQKRITIIPDYLLQRDGRNAWILDAKGPNQNITSGKNVEQAFSYAIHKDVRVPLYVLCNGRRLVVFHISQWPAVLDVALEEVGKVWPMLLDLVGTRAAWPDGLRPGFFPDFGLFLLKAGLAFDENTGKKIFHVLTSVALTSVAKSKDDLFVITGYVCDEDTPQYIVTFDATKEQYEKFLGVLEPSVARDPIRLALSQMPYQINLAREMPATDAIRHLPTVWVAGKISNQVITNENESFCALLVEKFI